MDVLLWAIPGGVSVSEQTSIPGGVSVSEQMSIPGWVSVSEQPSIPGGVSACAGAAPKRSPSGPEMFSTRNDRNGDFGPK